jgi:hypothetical protein
MAREFKNCCTSDEMHGRMKLGRLAVKMGNVTTLKLRQVIRTMNKDW